MILIWLIYDVWYESCMIWVMYDMSHFHLIISIDSFHSSFLGPSQSKHDWGDPRRGLRRTMPSAPSACGKGRCHRCLWVASQGSFGTWDLSTVTGWWWLVAIFDIFPEILGISNHPQLTNSYFSEGWPWPTNQVSVWLDLELIFSF